MNRWAGGTRPLLREIARLLRAQDRQRREIEMAGESDGPALVGRTRES